MMAHDTSSSEKHYLPTFFLDAISARNPASSSSNPGNPYSQNQPYASTSKVYYKSPSSSAKYGDYPVSTPEEELPPAIPLSMFRYSPKKRDNSHFGNVISTDPTYDYHLANPMFNASALNQAPQSIYKKTQPTPDSMIKNHRMDYPQSRFLKERVEASHYRGPYRSPTGEDSAVVLFGFPSQLSNSIITQFQHYGDIIEIRHAPKGDSWLWIKFATAEQAKIALSKNGKVLENGKYIIGVVQASTIQSQLDYWFDRADSNVNVAQAPFSRLQSVANPIQQDIKNPFATLVTPSAQSPSKIQSRSEYERNSISRPQVDIQSQVLTRRFPQDMVEPVMSHYHESESKQKNVEETQASGWGVYKPPKYLEDANLSFKQQDNSLWSKARQIFFGW